MMNEFLYGMVAAGWIAFAAYQAGYLRAQYKWERRFKDLNDDVSRAIRLPERAK